MKTNLPLPCFLLVGILACSGGPSTDKGVAAPEDSVVEAAAPVAEASGLLAEAPTGSPSTVESSLAAAAAPTETQVANVAQLRGSLKAIEGGIPSRSQLETALDKPRDELQALLADEDPQVRGNAAIALGYWADDPATRELLVGRALSEELKAHDRLAALTGLESVAEEAGAALSGLLSADQPPEVQAGVVRLLAGSPTHRGAVREFLDSGRAHPAAARIGGQLLTDGD